MGVLINWKNMDIIYCSNSYFFNIHSEMLSKIRTNNIKLNDQLKKLILDLEAGYDGIGLDVADYITYEDFLIFAPLLEQAIINYGTKNTNSE